jgi:tRNA(Phe) wybutosine-synthesizing methylase Tyw3
MANAKNNIFMTGLSGTVGRQMTLSQKKGDTIVGKKRGASSIPATDNQLDIQDRFKIASKYALAAIQNPVIKAAYAAAAKNNQSAYNVALADAFKAPEIKSISTTAYHGLVGDIITIRAVDDFKVETVQVVITTAAGVFVEQGNAVLTDNGLDWKYTATSLNGAAAGSKIRVTAKDLPANETVMEAVVA